MQFGRLILIIIGLLLCTGSVRIKALTHVEGLQDNPITGYGLIIGLAGTGDSPRNKDTTQAIANMLQTFGVTILPKEISARNSAAVIVSTNLPAFSHRGDKLDVNVASIGDAKSLSGGTLITTPLKGTDNQIYALAQGPISIGGFRYDEDGSRIQKNHPTSGLIPSGAIIERSIDNPLMDKSGVMTLILNHPDFTTATRIEQRINSFLHRNAAEANSPQVIHIRPMCHTKPKLIHFISTIENLVLTPDNMPLVVINERTGVIIAGNDVTIDPVTIAQGAIQLSIHKDYNVSQPTDIIDPNLNIHTAITPNVSMTLKEKPAATLVLHQGIHLSELIQTLRTHHATSRDIMTILESLQRAGALHAELIIQ